MFAILAEDTLYLKADEVSARDFVAEGKGPSPIVRKAVVKSLYPIGGFPNGCSTTLTSL
jgi:TfoX/Sxy family transcriptional regulator of competence genes